MLVYILTLRTMRSLGHNDYNADVSKSAIVNFNDVLQ